MRGVKDVVNRFAQGALDDPQALGKRSRVGRNYDLERSGLQDE